MTSVVVVGASVAGLLAARALADHVDDVVVLERERLDDTALPRGHVPQGRHLHLLLSAGLDLLVGWFPGIDDELESLGAVRVDGTRAWVHQSGGYRARGDWGRPVLSLTRPLLEQVVRRRVAALAGVTLRDGVVVARVEAGAGRVTGVVADGDVLRADLVVDCSGRSSRIAHQLEAAGILAPPVSRVSIDCAYASGFLPRSADDFDGSFLVCGSSPPESFRVGALLPVEGDRWMVTLAGVHGDVPGTGPDEVLSFARSLPTPALGEVIERLGPLSSTTSYRFPSSQRRHYEKVPAPPAGFVALGDAACSFNPIYGQGMSCAALQAQALAAAVADTGVRCDVLPARFNRSAARIIDAPWAIAVGADFLHPQTVGPKAPGTDLLNRYTQRLVRATHRSLPLARTFNRVVNLVEPPTALVRPSVVARVGAASVAGRRGSSRGVHPRVGSTPT
ncbi:MAG TPA: tryptophan 7-halogenase [Ornithinibacter sp.]|nr:tryptophan 7-halogenase [Ornithinibacter sp.]